jgi:PilZ domain
MLQDRRNTQRHAVSGPATIQSITGAPVGDCLVADVSDGGARILAHGFEVPPEFLLVFPDLADAARECRVVWRLDDEVGVEFVDEAEDGFALRLVG